MFADDGSITDAVVTLTDPPRLVDEKVMFQVTEIDGQIPAVGGSTILFIDPIRAAHVADFEGGRASAPRSKGCTLLVLRMLKNPAVFCQFALI